MKTKVTNSENKSATTKVCTICKTEKSMDDFGKLAASKDGHLSFCKECNRQRNKNYRLSMIDVAGTVVRAAVSNEIDWSKAPVREHDVRVLNDCVIGDYFKNVESEDFVLEINEWDNDNKGERKTVKTHKMFVKGSELKKMIEFPESEKMRNDLTTVTDQKWGDFVFHYTKLFFKAHPDNPIGLRFKKHGPSGKCINVGISNKNIPVLEEKFSK